MAARSHRQLQRGAVHVRPLADVQLLQPHRQRALIVARHGCAAQGLTIRRLAQRQVLQQLHHRAVGPPRRRRQLVRHASVATRPAGSGRSHHVHRHQQRRDLARARGARVGSQRRRDALLALHGHRDLAQGRVDPSAPTRRRRPAHDPAHGGAAFHRRRQARRRPAKCTHATGEGGAAPGSRTAMVVAPAACSAPLRRECKVGEVAQARDGDFGGGAAVWRGGGGGDGI
jgi:hypothetical protein